MEPKPGDRKLGPGDKVKYWPDGTLKPEFRGVLPPKPSVYPNTGVGKEAVKPATLPAGSQNPAKPLQPTKPLPPAAVVVPNNPADPLNWAGGRISGRDLLFSTRRITELKNVDMRGKVIVMVPTPKNVPSHSGDSEYWFQVVPAARYADLTQSPNFQASGAKKVDVHFVDGHLIAAPHGSWEKELQDGIKWYVNVYQKTHGPAPHVIVDKATEDGKLVTPAFKRNPKSAVEKGLGSAVGDLAGYVGNELARLVDETLLGGVLSATSALDNDLKFQVYKYNALLTGSLGRNPADYEVWRAYNSYKKIGSPLVDGIKLDDDIPLTPKYYDEFKTRYYDDFKGIKNGAKARPLSSEDFDFNKGGPVGSSRVSFSGLKNRAGSSGLVRRALASAMTKKGVGDSAKYYIRLTRAINDANKIKDVAVLATTPIITLP